MMSLKIHLDSLERLRIQKFLLISMENVLDMDIFSLWMKLQFRIALKNMNKTQL